MLILSPARASGPERTKGTMPCYHPMLAYRSREVNANGKRPITFNPRDAYSDLTVTLPCGQCIGCRLERSRQWAMRCVHEASQHEDNVFITLTFDQQNLDPSGSLQKADFQKFMKRLRRSTGIKIRYFHCGEYGEKFGRPHHHACLFGIDFPDKKLVKVINGNNLYESEELRNNWKLGNHTIGDVTFESAAYVARYITKKITGDQAEAHYQGKEPEYVTMSRRPGIAANWFARYKTDVFPDDFVVVRNGIICKPPKFYLNQLAEAELKPIKTKRATEARKRKDDNSLERLSVKEQVKYSRIKQLTRTYEHETENI